tara:strand:+ start:4272 stop:4673 length:402 start_codon:yes stop_codon:yes gene_type:complete
MRPYQHHIRLYVDQELPNEAIQIVYKTVELVVPEGVLRAHVRFNKEPTDVLYHIKDGRHAYDMPTTRDLTPEETETLFIALDTVMNIDFDIESTTPVVGTLSDPEKDAIEVGLDAYKREIGKNNDESASHNRA